MAVPLDEVFEYDEEGLFFLRQCILRILVFILVLEGQHFQGFRDDLHINQRKDKQEEEERMALLGKDEVFPIAIEAWKNTIGRQEIEETLPSPTRSNVVPALVEILFDLLPALRAARRSCCSGHAPDETPRTVASVGMPVQIPGKPAFKKSTTALSFDKVRRSLDAAAVILAKHDGFFTKQRGSVTLYTPIFERERTRLADFYASRRDKPLPKGDDPKALKSMQTRLVQILSDFVIYNTGEPSTRKQHAWSNQGRAGEKAYFAYYYQQAENIDAVIEHLKEITNEMKGAKILPKFGSSVLATLLD